MNTSTFRITATRSLKAIVTAVALLVTTAGAQAQDHPAHRVSHDEDYGNTLNLGVGLVYFNYLDNSVPIFMADYEFDVARDFTLAPFIGIASYTSNNDYHYNNEYYYYRQTLIPIGVKGTYYFDRLLQLNPKWDIYGAASLGFTYNKITWEDGYGGHDNINSSSHAYLDLHIGAEYHINRRLGIFLDLSTGVSTVGLAIHHR